ncbi:hypothetical protein [Crocosphaera sp. Alani8]|uniref:hypothetical protein n=1 Tax=Crocosphaera sp. Alani8 TaxID=3038952 RepID=UPI00313BC76F
MKQVWLNAFDQEEKVIYYEQSSPYKTVELRNSWALGTIGTTIKSRHSNGVEVSPIFIAGVKWALVN